MIQSFFGVRRGIGVAVFFATLFWIGSGASSYAFVLTPLHPVDAVVSPSMCPDASVCASGLVCRGIIPSSSGGAPHYVCVSPTLNDEAVCANGTVCGQGQICVEQKTGIEIACTLSNPYCTSRFICQEKTAVTPVPSTGGGGIITPPIVAVCGDGSTCSGGLVCIAKIVSPTCPLFACRIGQTCPVCKAGQTVYTCGTSSQTSSETALKQALVKKFGTPYTCQVGTAQLGEQLQSITLSPKASGGYLFRIKTAENGILGFFNTIIIRRGVINAQGSIVVDSTTHVPSFCFANTQFPTTDIQGGSSVSVSSFGGSVIQNPVSTIVQPTSGGTLCPDKVTFCYTGKVCSRGGAQPSGFFKVSLHYVCTAPGVLIR